MKKTVVSIVLGLLVLSTPAFADIKVIATFSILGDIVKHVAGDKTQVITLVGSDADAHTYEPTPQDSVHLSEANIIFANGLHFEHWLNDLYQSSGTKAKLIDVTEGVVTPRLIEGDDKEIDPHAWHNVDYVIGMTKKIVEALSLADPLNAAYYQDNAKAYQDQLMALNKWIELTVETLPVDKRKLITSHDTFGYFAKRYGFLIVGAAVASATTEAADPSARQMSDLIKVIKIAGVPALFTENIKSPKLMNMLASEAKVNVAPSLYTDALGESGSVADTYIKMMQYNVKTMVDALKGNQQ